MKGVLRMEIGDEVELSDEEAGDWGRRVFVIAIDRKTREFWFCTADELAAGTWSGRRWDPYRRRRMP